MPFRSHPPEEIPLFTSEYAAGPFSKGRAVALLAGVAVMVGGVLLAAEPEARRQVGNVIEQVVPDLDQIEYPFKPEKM